MQLQKQSTRIPSTPKKPYFVSIGNPKPVELSHPPEDFLQTSQTALNSVMRQSNRKDSSNAT